MGEKKKWLISHRIPSANIMGQFLFSLKSVAKLSLTLTDFRISPKVIKEAIVLCRNLNTINKTTSKYT